ncbi:MAG: thiamine-phosphate kinase [Elusimicrobia bacterium HGW-Elusimicrobia-4]|nr:MAG: thiamine-phosphate kinase [Elusimicrobia bacterium HGW-Elusimicrobia-4]
MKISQLGEFGLIERIRRKNKKAVHHPGTVIGTGDDCSVVKCSRREHLLFTTDTLVENVHFSKKYYSFFDIGYKSLADNLSDIAAMGGSPLYALITAGFPAETKIEDIDEIYRGISKLASEFNVEIIGGDTVKSPTALIISITLIGKTIYETGVKRSGATVGDLIFTTGNFGDSSAGLYLLQKGIPGYKELKKKHLNPYPRIKEGLFIAKSDFATSMIDSSDGFNKSVRFICQESKVGCEIYFDKIPVSNQLKKFVTTYHLSQDKSCDYTTYCLFGGEEYELIFTVPPSKKAYFKKRFYEVGKITKNKKIVYLDSNSKKINLKDKGYDHFKK